MRNLLPKSPARTTIARIVVASFVVISPSLLFAQSVTDNPNVRPIVPEQFQWKVEGNQVVPNYPASSPSAVPASKAAVPLTRKMVAQELKGPDTENVVSPVPQDDADRPSEDLKEEDSFSDEMDAELREESEDEEDLEQDSPRSFSDSDSFGSWPPKSMREIKVDIREFDSNVPRDRSYQLVQSYSADWNSFQPGRKVFAWAAPNIKYQPLYYEDVALERYGQARGDVAQFAVSSFHFFKSAVLLPYSMAMDHPRSCDYPLGFCRPGNTAPATLQKHIYGRPNWLR